MNASTSSAEFFLPETPDVDNANSNLIEQTITKHSHQTENDFERIRSSVARCGTCRLAPNICLSPPSIRSPRGKYRKSLSGRRYQRVRRSFAKCPDFSAAATVDGSTPRLEPPATRYALIRNRRATVTQCRKL